MTIIHSLLLVFSLEAFYQFPCRKYSPSHTIHFTSALFIYFFVLLIQNLHNFFVIQEIFPYFFVHFCLISICTYSLLFIQYFFYHFLLLRFPFFLFFLLVIFSYFLFFCILFLTLLSSLTEGRNCAFYNFFVYDFFQRALERVIIICCCCCCLYS